MDRRITTLYDEYTHGLQDRRKFLARLAALTGGMTAALAWVRVLEANAAKAPLIAETDSGLAAGRSTYPGPGKDVIAYTARPRTEAKLPAVLVIHENRGLNAHIEDVSRRLALAGFIALAPDLLSPRGGTPADADSARAWIGQLPPEATIANLTAGLDFLKKRPDANGKVGAVGFCWGGGMVGELAVTSPSLDAGVVYYGRAPAPDRVGSIRAPLLLHYAGLDSRINADVPAFEKALQEGRKTYEKFVYEGVQHAFHNDTSEARYDKAAAELSWSRTLAFLEKHLTA